MVPAVAEVQNVALKPVIKDPVSEPAKEIEEPKPQEYNADLVRNILREAEAEKEAEKHNISGVATLIKDGIKS